MVIIMAIIAITALPLLIIAVLRSMQRDPNKDDHDK
jgi:hypothetical protein